MPDRPTAGEVATDVEIRLHRVDDRRVAVRMTTRTPASGAVVFVVPESWGGVAPCAEEIRGLRAEAADGRPLGVSRPDGRRWRVASDPGSAVTAVYELSTPDQRLRPAFGEHYRPLVTPELFHALGPVALVSPEHLLDGAQRWIELSWIGFDGEVLSSFSRGPDPVVVRRTFDRFRHAVFLAGDVRVRERELQGAPLRVALHGEQWNFTDDQFVDLAERIVRAERGFFDDWVHPPYLISLVPIGPPAELGFQFGGTGLTDSFALFMAPGATLAPGMVGSRGVRHLLAHECFHQWNGIDIDRAPPEELAYWFSEGFTEFYARRILHREGLETVDGIVRSLNRSIRDYWTSPARGAANDAILAGFWSDEGLRDLPYRRGDLVATALDQAIRDHSGGARSLDDLMRSIHAAAVARGEEVSTASLLAEFERWVAPETATHLRGVVEDGAPIELPLRLDEPALVRTTQVTGAFEIGFDVDASREARTLVGVLAGSAAHAAGLRDGMALRGLTAYWNDVTKPVQVDVETDGRVERISYSPVRDPIDIPAYRPLEAGEVIP